MKLASKGKAILALLVLLITAQCSEDKPDMKPSISASAVVQSTVLPSAQQLAANADFAELVTLTHSFGDIVYNNLRDARSERVRTAKSKRLNVLYQYSNNKDSLTLSLRLLGFEDLNQFATNFNRFGALGAKLSAAGIRLQSFPPDLLLKAFELTSKAQNHKYPNIFASPYARGGGGICYNCHFNNCDECAGQIDNPTIPTDPDGPGYPHACIQRVQNTRTTKIHSQEVTLYGSLMGCGLAGVGVGAQVCAGTIWFPPLGVGAGVAGFCITAGGCGVYALTHYRAEVAVIEAEYQQERAACF